MSTGAEWIMGDACGVCDVGRMVTVGAGCLWEWCLWS